MDPIDRASLYHLTSSQKSKTKLHYDRQSVGRSVLVSGTHLGTATNFPLLSLISFRQLRLCWCGAPSLTRERVFNLQCNDASSMSSDTATDGLSASSSWCRAPYYFGVGVLLAADSPSTSTSGYRAFLWDP
jgi:hypothetical protein